MLIRPTGSKVIVKPDVAPATSDGGLIVPESARRDPAMSGIVIAVGNGPASAHLVRASTIAACRVAVQRVADGVMAKNIQVGEWTERDSYSVAVVRDMIEAELTSRIRDVPDGFSEVSPGDRVCFSYTAGQHLIVDDERYLVMQEDDIVAVLDDKGEDGESPKSPRESL